MRTQLEHCPRSCSRGGEGLMIAQFDPGVGAISTTMMKNWLIWTQTVLYLLVDFIFIKSPTLTETVPFPFPRNMCSCFSLRSLAYRKLRTSGAHFWTRPFRTRFKSSIRSTSGQRRAAWFFFLKQDIKKWWRYKHFLFYDKRWVLRVHASTFW